MNCLIRLLLSVTIMFPASTALAADLYPVKTVRIVVPFAAGGSTDLLARNVAQRLNDAWKQPVIVDNRAGGGGIVGSEYVVKSPADGYTLLLGTNTTNAVAASLYAKLPYDVQRDFARSPRSRRFRSCCRCILRSRQKRCRTWWRSPKLVPTSSLRHRRQRQHLAHGDGAVRVDGKNQNGARAVQRHRSGADRAAGRASVVNVRRHHDFFAARAVGKLRALAVSSLQRSPTAPQIPTVAESGYPGFEAMVWFGLFAPAGAPPETIRKVSEETARVLNTPSMRAILAGQGLEIVASNPADFAARVNGEIGKWRKVIQEAGIKLE